MNNKEIFLFIFGLGLVQNSALALMLRKEFMANFEVPKAENPKGDIDTTPAQWTAKGI